jgi:predicted alpha/beta-hydrolase family hydrolase
MVRKKYFLPGSGNFRDEDPSRRRRDRKKTATIEKMRVVLGHGASGNAASMKPYVVGFTRRGINAVAVDLPKGKAEKAVPVFIKTSGRGHEVIGGGQSFGGRVASMAAIEADFGGLVLFSYPLHRPGHTDELRTEHLPSIRCPTLFLSGDRDQFARIDLLKEAVKLVPNARLEIFNGQGHGLLAVLDQALDLAAEFILTNCK